MIRAAPPLARRPRPAAWQALRSGAKHALFRTTAPVYRHRPIVSWPGWMGRLAEVKLPSNTRALPAPSRGGSANIKILFQLLEETAGIEGAVAECGVFRGSTLIPMACFLRQRGLRKRVFGLDSFRGFDDSVETDVSLGGSPNRELRRGHFAATSPALIERRARPLVGDGIELVAGFFQESLPRLASHTFSFVHLDCDLYESYRVCLEFFYPRMATGGILLFDEHGDPGWPGSTLAIDGFFADKPESCRSIQRDNTIRSYVCKL